jgi:hypothetical protein
MIMDTPDRRALFEQFLRCIDREENLIHYRMSWGMQWNAALLGAAIIFFSANLSTAGFDVNITTLKKWAIIAISILGASTGYLSHIGIRAAHTQSRYLIDGLERRLQIENHDWEVTEFIRPYGDPQSVHPTARWVSGFFPLLFSIFWLCAGVFVLSNSVTFH